MSENDKDFEDFLKMLQEKAKDDSELSELLDTLNNDDAGDDEDDLPSLVDVLLDSSNTSNIVLNDEEGEIEFKQVATIPYDGNLYALLSPVEEILGVEADSYIVFRIDMDDDTATIEEDDDILNKVNDIYINSFNKIDSGFFLRMKKVNTTTC